ncbi:MAG: ATP-binding protein [Candidatus Omnitrophica bacterium]|nr:ATP-binding protein [Candidatus Omnitrophota bacterium]
MIKRRLLKELKGHLSQKEISFIIGPRQAGKTTLMLLLEDHLKKKGEQTLFFNLDIEADKQFFASQQGLIKKIKLEIGQTKGFVFIDEIQRKENAGVFLKGIYDMGFAYKFIVSGSGSMELKEKIHESLAGRKRIFELSTLSFEEFVNFRTAYKYEKQLLDFFTVDKEKGEGFLEEYLNFGGYPRVVLEEKLKEKRRIIDEIYQSYLEKDITYLLQVKKSEDFSNLVKAISYQMGNLINFSGLSSTLGVSQKTVKRYLWYLQKTFILEKITPYFRNVRKEIRRAPIFYFYDIGLRNYALGIFGNVNAFSDIGFLFQNFVFNILKENLAATGADVHFWRTKDRAEVDFVIDFGKEILPIEVKCKKLKKPEITRSLRSFIEKYQPSKSLIVNLSLEETLSIKGTKILFVPFYKISEALN